MSIPNKVKREDTPSIISGPSARYKKAFIRGYLNFENYFFIFWEAFLSLGHHQSQFSQRYDSLRIVKNEADNFVIYAGIVIIANRQCEDFDLNKLTIDQFKEDYISYVGYIHPKMQSSEHD